MEWNSSLSCPLQQHIRTKQSKASTKTHGKKSRRKIRAKPGKWGKKAPPRATRGSHHGPWWSPRAGRGGHCPVVPVFSMRCVLGPFVQRLGLRVLPFLGVFWASLQASFDTLGPYLLAWIHLKHFSPKLGLNHRNLQ